VLIKAPYKWAPRLSEQDSVAGHHTHAVSHEDQQPCIDFGGHGVRVFNRIVEGFQKSLGLITQNAYFTVLLAFLVDIQPGLLDSFVAKVSGVMGGSTPEIALAVKFASLSCRSGVEVARCA